MSTQYTNDLLSLPYPQENDADWDTTLNNMIGLIAESTVGYVAVAMGDANVTLTTTQGATNQSRPRFLKTTGALTQARNLVVPSQAGWWFVWNACTGGFAVQVKTSGGTGVAVHPGGKLLVMCDGSETYLLEAPINALTAETAVAVDDEVALYDLSAKLIRKMTIQNVMKVLNSLTEDTAPDQDNDFFLSYDASASDVKKVKFINMLKRIANLTEDTAPHADNDFVATWDASASTAKKVALFNLFGISAIETLTTTSGSTVTSSTLAKYKLIIAMIDDVSATGTANLRVAVSEDDGSNWSGNVTLDQGPSSGYNRAALVLIFNTGVAGTNKYIFGVLGASGGDASINTDEIASVTGVINKIRFSLSAGSYDAGAIRLWGVR